MFILISITVYSKKKMKTIIEDLILHTHTPKKKFWSFVMIIEIIIKVNTIDSNHIVSIKKKSTLWCKPQSTHFEIQQTILEYLLKKAKIQIFDRNPDPMVIIETRTKGISITPWPSDYNWIMNQRYKVWTPQGRISDNFIVLEEPKEEQSLTFSNFFIQ